MDDGGESPLATCSLLDLAWIVMRWSESKATLVRICMSMLAVHPRSSSMDPGDIVGDSDSDFAALVLDQA